MVSDSDVFCQALAEPERLRRCERSERLASIDRVWAARAGTRVSALGRPGGRGVTDCGLIASVTSLGNCARVPGLARLRASACLGRRIQTGHILIPF